MARTSTRSASRDLPSSPPNRESPIGRVIRTTRSQSIDLDARRSRQGSVESTGSNNQPRNRRVPRATTASTARNLPIVTEADELLSEKEDEGQDVEQDEEEGEDPDATKVAEPSEFDMQGDDLRSNQANSPAHTAISDTTVNTLHTERVMESIDSKSAIETLSDLYDTARQIITKSANKNVRPKDTKRHLKFLNALCNGFEALREPYGTEKFIEVKLVLRKLFGPLDSEEYGSKVPGDSAVPLSAILHSANLATLISEVNEQRQMGQDLDDKARQQKLTVFLQSLEKAFPGPFVSEFAANSDSGGSKLINESFDMVLDIRTHLFITVSRQLEMGEPSFDPDRVLTTLFLEGEDENGSFDGIDFEEQRDRAGERVDLIRKTFKPPENATGPGEYVDFDMLDDLYPISEFFNNLIGYGQKRLAEVENNVETRGGIENVIESLQELVKDIESDPEPDIEVQFNAPKRVMEQDSNPSLKMMMPPPPPPKTQKSHHLDPRALRRLLDLKNKAGSQQLGDREGSSRPNPSANARSSLTGPLRSRPEVQQQDSAITSAFKAFSKSQNKENRLPDQHQESRAHPSTTARRGMYGRHPDAERVQWTEDSQGLPELPQPKNKKRKTPLPPDVQTDEEEFSSDPGFQNDQRNMDPPRKTAALKSSVRPNKRVRTEAGESSRVQNSHNGDRPREVFSPIGPIEDGDDDDDDDDDIQSQFASERQSQQIRERSQLQQGPRISPRPLRRSPRIDLDDDEDSLELPDDDELRPAPFSQIQGTARTNARTQATKVGVNRPQTREVWSDADTDRLIRRIAKYGSNWAEIERRGGFDRDNLSQVNLKDRARNMKTNMLLAGELLPKHFENVKLNAKLIARVKTTWPEYNPITDTGAYLRMGIRILLACWAEEAHLVHEMVKQDGLEWVGEMFGLEPRWTTEPDIVKIELIARKHLKFDVNSLCRVTFYAEGAFNKLYKLKTADADACFLIRVTLPVDPFNKTNSEVATINFIRQNTDIPVSRILAFDDSSENELGSRSGARNPPPSTSIASDDNDIAGEALQGSIPALPVLGQMVSLVFFWGDHIAQDIPRGPFAHSSDWILARLNLVLTDQEKILNTSKDEDDIEDAQNSKTLAERLLKLLPSILPANQDILEQSVLFHDDLSMQNILVDDDGNITGIIDWECVSALPLWRSCSLPELFRSRERTQKPERDQYAPDSPSSSPIDSDLDSDFDNEGINSLYWEYLLEYELTQLRSLFLHEMHVVAPEWTQEYMNAVENGKVDFELAVQHCDNSWRTYKIRAWLDAREKGEYWSLRGKFLE
ncbi:hypothetical protein SBOR_5428 [Sclerotinia borealis F-4128]|uniref:Myb-like domain-containing protein n=1 Tax=Sclerotinia borealis (strain F-4128) TaxID=1432307 RepID=W9CBR8_SCLBF|nr:hypothetical protein SBOR_5428 [Sclerotinia borealis F-4128]